VRSGTAVLAIFIHFAPGWAGTLDDRQRERRPLARRPEEPRTAPIANNRFRFVCGRLSTPPEPGRTLRSFDLQKESSPEVVMREVLIGVALAATAALAVPVVALSHGTQMQAGVAQQSQPATYNE
jgi:hypothetical protein